MADGQSVYLKTVLLEGGNMDSDHRAVHEMVERRFGCVSYALVRRGHELILRLDGVGRLGAEECAAVAAELGAQMCFEVSAAEFSDAS